MTEVTVLTLTWVRGRVLWCCILPLILNINKIQIQDFWINNIPKGRWKILTMKLLLWWEPCSMPMEFSILTASTFSLGFPSLINSSQAFVSTTCWLKLLFSRSPGTSILLYKIASSQSSSDSISEQHLAQLVTPTFLKCFSHLASRTQQSRSFPPTSLAVLSQFPLLDSSLLPRPLNVRPAQGSVFVLAFSIYVHTLHELLMWLQTLSLISWSHKFVHLTPASLSSSLP